MSAKQITWMLFFFCLIGMGFDQYWRYLAREKSHITFKAPPKPQWPIMLSDTCISKAVDSTHYIWSSIRDSLGMRTLPTFTSITFDSTTTIKPIGNPYWKTCDYSDTNFNNYNFFIRYQLAWIPGGGRIIGKVLDRIPEDSMKAWIGKKIWDSLTREDEPKAGDTITLPEDQPLVKRGHGNKLVHYTGNHTQWDSTFDTCHQIPFAPQPYMWDQRIEIKEYPPTLFPDRIETHDPYIVFTQKRNMDSTWVSYEEVYFMISNRQPNNNDVYGANPVYSVPGLMKYYYSRRLYEWTHLMDSTHRLDIDSMPIQEDRIIIWNTQTRNSRQH